MGTQGLTGQVAAQGAADPSAALARISILGPMLVGGSDAWQLRDRTVLGVLVVRAPAAVTVDEIGFALWGDDLPGSHRKVIQGSVLRLRRELGREAIRTVDDAYQLGLDGSAIDAGAFEAKFAEARDHLAAGRADRASREALSALAMWRGTPLTELDGWVPAEAESRRLVAMRESAEDLHLDARLRAGHYDAAAADAERLAEEAPYRESRWTLWARVLYAAGRQAEALGVLRRLGDTLREELGVDPNPEVAALELAILQQDPALRIPAAVTKDAACPWPGLLPYEPADASLFFGRDADVQVCIERLRAGRGLVVVGRSGSGKSSLVRAGVVPRLLAEGDDVRLITPGSDPVVALGDLPDEAVVVVDQAEEAVTQWADEAQRREFFERLAGRPGPVVLVARADLLDELSGSPGFVELLERGLFVLRPLDEAGLRAAIEGPAARVALRLEAGLVELLLEECGGEPGALPLLSHTLAETWRRAEGNSLTVDGYRSSGGIRTAIATSAEQVYESLDDAHQVQMRRLFRRLVRFDGDEPVRARVPRRVTAAGLAEQLLSTRLLVASDDGDLQIAHEQLARHWPRLTAWIVEDRDGDRLLRHLASEAREWDDAGRPSGLLYRGVRLGAAAEWIAGRGDELDDVERQFVDESLGASHAELRRTRRTNSRLRAALAASGVLLAVSIAVTTFAIHQRESAREARDSAQTARDSAQAARDYSDALRLGTEAEATPDPSVAFGLVAEALSIDDSEASRIQALEVFARFRALESTGESPPGTDWPDGAPENVGDVALSFDNSTAAEAVAGSIRLTDAATGELLGVIDNDGLAVIPGTLAFDSTGRLLAAGLRELESPFTYFTTVLNVTDRSEVARFDLGGETLSAHRFSADGRSVYSYGTDGLLHQWDLTGARSIIRLSDGEPLSFRAGDVMLSRSDDSVDAWIAEACRLAGRPLTEDEWRAYLGDRPYDPTCAPPRAVRSTSASMAAIRL